MLKDLKYALRVLLQTKGWTAVVLISLALGIGANTALFTAVNGVLLQSVAVPNPDNLVRLRWAGQNDMTRSSSEYGSIRPYNGKNTRITVSYEEYRQLRQANQTLVDLLACAPTGQLNVIKDGVADVATGLEVSGNYFTLLRVGALKGRTLVEDDDKPGAPAVAVISEAYWKKRFGSNPNVSSGIPITVNNIPMTIVGVIPSLFRGIQRLSDNAPDVTVPVSLDSQLIVSPGPPGQPRLSQPWYWWLQVMGRLKPGITMEQVKANLEPVFQNTARAGFETYMNGLTAEQRGLSTNQRRSSNVPEFVPASGSHGFYDLDNNSAQSVRILSVVVIVVLLIVCANVANLLLSRATTRQKEISMRLSLGASRGRLIRQLLTESIVLSSLGGALGVLVGIFSRQLLPFGDRAPIDWRVFAFVAGVSMVTGILFGLVPALRATRVELAGAMKETSRSVTRTRSWLTKGLLVVQVGLSLVLLVGAGLFLQTLRNLHRVDFGFNPDRLLMFRVNPALNGYDADRISQFYLRLGDALRAMPGVQAAAFTRVPMLAGNISSTSAYVEGKTTVADDGIHVMNVSPEFFATMQIPLLSGRAFTDRDVKTAPKVAIVNVAAAKKLFGTENVVGRRMGGSPEKNTEMEIVGVVGDAKYSEVRENPPTTFYRPYLQYPVASMVAMVRTAGDPSKMIEQARRTVHEIDPALLVANVSTQMEQIDGRMNQERLFANAYSLFGGLATLLACIGLFGLMSYAVARRTNEIGIRMALGAQRGEVMGMVLRESLVLVAIGVGLGLGAVLYAGKFVKSILFGLPPTDAMAIGAAIALMLIVSALAGYLPARRASRVDPLVALRYE